MYGSKTCVLGDARQHRKTGSLMQQKNTKFQVLTIAGPEWYLYTTYLCGVSGLFQRVNLGQVKRIEDAGAHP